MFFRYACRSFFCVFCFFLLLLSVADPVFSAAPPPDGSDLKKPTTLVSPVGPGVDYWRDVRGGLCSAASPTTVFGDDTVPLVFAVKTCFVGINPRDVFATAGDKGDDWQTLKADGVAKYAGIENMTISCKQAKEEEGYQMFFGRYQTHFVDVDACFLDMLLQQMPFLSDLTLQDYYTDKSGARKFLEALRSNINLTALCFRSTEIGDEGATTLGKMLEEERPPLKTLRIIGARGMGDEEIKALSKGLTYNTTLDLVELSYTNTGDAGATHLAQALEFNTTLRKLEVTNSDIGPRGAEALAGVLKRNKTLKELVLTEYDGMETVADALKERVVWK